MAKQAPLSQYGRISKPNKRKYDGEEKRVKKPKLQLECPEHLQELISLHKHFLQAFNIHAAHHGFGTPAELGSLMKTITKLWKKREVQQEDIQRVLAIYEIAAGSITLVHQHGPFKLVCGGNRISIEYVRSAAPNEQQLQCMYEEDVAILQSDPKFESTLTDLPLLSYSVGTQTLYRKEKAATAKDSILNRPSQNTPNRTLSLFERIQEKQLASSLHTKPTAEIILRRHAIGRMVEVVEILRMKQQQKLGSIFTSSVHTSPSKVRGKVCLSLSQVINTIKTSVSNPIGDDEIRTCIKILSDEVPGQWLTSFTLGKVQSIVFNGPGLSGIEIKKIVED